MEWDISRRQCAYVCAGIVALIWVTYLLSLGNAFVTLDDNLLILKNSAIHRISPSTVAHIFTSYDPELYIPLTLLWYQILYAIAGPNPVVFHTANLVLHTANTMLVVWILAQLVRKRWLGVLGGALFAVHPIHVETVVWASATKDLLSAFFSLLSLGLYLHFLTTEDRKFFRYSLLSFACGLFAKVVPIALPLVLLLADRAHGRPLSRKALLEKKWFFALSVLFGIVAIVGKSQNPQLLGITDTVLMTCKSMAFFMGKLLIPTGLSVLHPQDTSITLAHTEFLLPAAVAIGILAFLVWSYTYARNLCLGTGMFMLFLAPNFSTFSKNGYLFFASERYAYLPSVGLLLLLTLGIKRHAERPRVKRAAVVAVCCVIPIFAVLSYGQARTWKDTEHLYRNVLRRYPNSTMALTNLGGELVGTEREEEAMTLFLQAYELNGDSIAAINMGLLSLKEGNRTEAEEWFTKAIESVRSHSVLTAQDMIAYYMLADTLDQSGKPDDALSLYREAAERGMAFAEPHINLGIAYQKRGMRTEAEAAFRAAIERNATLPAPHYHLAGILAETGYLDEAAKELRLVLRLQPDYENARRHLQRILEMSPTR